MIQRQLPYEVCFLSVEVKSGNTRLRPGVGPDDPSQIQRLYDSMGLQQHEESLREKNLKPEAFMNFK